MGWLMKTSLRLSSGDEIANEYMKNREPEGGIRAGEFKGGWTSKSSFVYSGSKKF